MVKRGLTKFIARSAAASKKMRWAGALMRWRACRSSTGPSSSKRRPRRRPRDGTSFRRHRPWKPSLRLSKAKDCLSKSSSPSSNVLWTSLVATRA
eukprot:11217836-Alexandrium_andersonii.AAC.1